MTNDARVEERMKLVCIFYSFEDISQSKSREAIDKLINAKHSKHS